MTAKGGQRVLASLFDRLTDAHPRDTREVPPPVYEQLREHKNTVARDLTNLLNTRRNENDIPEEFQLTRQSLAGYGVQDFTTAPMDREAIRTAIERTIRVYEPRLTRVQVTLDESSNGLEFLYRISGMLRVNVGLEPVVYDAKLPSESRRFRVIANR
jgi:type VI secretion system lysozyme-like protein